MLGIAKVLSSAISGRGFPRYSLYISTISVPLTLALYFTLIPLFDEWGAAIASSFLRASRGAGAWLLPTCDGHRAREGFVPRREDLVDYRLAAGLARDRFLG